MLLVVGPSGSGKSTLARAVAGLLSTDFAGAWQGSFQVGDVDVARGNEPDAETLDAFREPTTTAGLGAGIVLQDPASQLVMERVGDDVAFGLESLAWPIEVMRARVPEVLAQVGLADFDGRRSTRLSGGEQQRVAIAGVLAPRPRVLVLDEPTAHLDANGAESVFAILAALKQGHATTIVLVEHRAGLAWPLADIVLALDDEGRPIDVGRTSKVLSRSRSRLERAGIWLPEEGAAPITVSSKRAGSIPVLTMDQARFAFEPARPVLRAVDLEVSPGDRLALVGPNGSGKTTLLRLALGLLKPVAGRIRLGGRDPAHLPPIQVARLAGYVPQEPELGFLGETVGEEVELGLEPEQVGYARELADRLGLGLERFGDRSPYRLSGGEQRRLSLVTALARRPLLLALDEPTFGQDRRGHEALVAALDELVGEGSAVLAATHDERFVRDATDRRLELADGWVVANDPVDGTDVGAGGAAT